MKKLITISLILAAIFLTSGQVFARPHFRVFFGPPRVYIGPPVYAPAPGYYYNPYRAWVPGHWESRWTPYGPERIWIPGYWQYR